MSFVVKKGAVCTKKGFPSSPVWICDKRLAFSYDESGIERLEYFLPTAKEGNRIMFKRGIFDSFRASIELEDGLRYSPEYENVRLFPYGFETDWRVRDSVYQFGVYAVDGNIVFTLLGGQPCTFRLTFFENTQYIPAYDGDLDSRDYGLERVWKEWTQKENALYGGFVETKTHSAQELSVEESAINVSLFERVTSTCQELRIGIGSDSTCRFQKTKINYRQEILLSHIDSSRIAVVFCADNEDIFAKTESFCLSIKEELERQKQRYEAIVRKLPKIKTPYKSLNDFCAIAPIYHESLKGDMCGIVRAKTTHYWTWGWDSMITNKPTILCWQDSKHIKGMLEYFQRTSDHEKGVAHWFRFDNSVKQYMAIPAQGFYSTLLADYISYTQDEEALREFYPFAREIFYRILNTESKVKGLFIGVSMFPDFPECVHETGRDISLFNNTVAYNAMRNMETLAYMYGDIQTAREAKRITEDTETNFFQTFFDKEKGYFVFSVDADTLQQRKCYSICGYLWDGNYHDDLLGIQAKKCIDFILKNGLSKLAFRNYAIFGDTYDADANQLHVTWGVVEEIILRMAKYNQEHKPIDQWIKKVGAWTEKLTCPEGESYEFETDKPIFDRWNCEPGTWQAYTARKWYEETLGIICGITLDYGSISFTNPYAPFFSVENIKIQGKTISVKTDGRGEAIAWLNVNGEYIYGTQKVPFDKLADGKLNRITIGLGDAQNKRLTCAYNVMIKNYRYNKGQICFTASSYGTKRFYIDGVKEFFLNGIRQELKMCTSISQSYVCVNFEQGKVYEIELR